MSHHHHAPMLYSYKFGSNLSTRSRDILHTIKCYVDIDAGIKANRHSANSATIRESSHGSAVCKEHYANRIRTKNNMSPPLLWGDINIFMR